MRNLGAVAAIAIIFLLNPRGSDSTCTYSYSDGDYLIEIFDMPRNYRRKTNKGNWTSDTLKRAIQSIRDQELSIRAASQKFKIPFTTLQNRLKKNNNESAKFGRKALLSVEQEREIAEQLLKLSRLFYGLTKNELRRTVYSFVTANNIPNPFNHVTKMAGRDWLKGFLKRNKNISVRKPEATSINRITAFNKPAVSRFFDNLDSVLKTHNFQADRIFNVDETGVGPVHKPEEILAEKGVKQVGAATSGERGKTHTACCCVSASGFYVPPMLIFPRVRMSPKLMIDGPPGAIYRCTKSGWIDESLFMEWLKHFASKTHPSPTDPVLLVMDNHTSHVSMEAYNFCVENGIHVVTLPPHTSHKLQPLDRTVFGPFKRRFHNESETEMKAHAFQSLTSEQIPSLFRKAWTKTCSTEKAVNGFRATGIYPFNPNVFPDDEFYQLDAEFEEVVIESTTEKPSTTTTTAETLSRKSDEETDEGEFESVGNSNITSTANVDVPKVGEKVDEPVSYSSFAPLPQKQKSKKNNRGCKKQLSEIFTSPAHKGVLEEKRKKKLEREQRKITAIKNRAMKLEPSDDNLSTKKAKKEKKVSTTIEQAKNHHPLSPAAAENRAPKEKVGLCPKTETATIDKPEDRRIDNAQKHSAKRSKRAEKDGTTIGEPSHLSVSSKNRISKKSVGTAQEPKKTTLTGRSGTPIKTRPKPTSSKNAFDGEVSEKTRMSTRKRCKPSKFEGVGLAEPPAKKKRGKAVQHEKSEVDGINDKNELLDGLCLLCGEKYEAEFFVCVRCNNCIHIGCSSQQGQSDEICTDCSI